MIPILELLIWFSLKPLEKLIDFAACCMTEAYCQQESKRLYKISNIQT